MAIREDLVASAAQFLQDPSVAGSSLDNRVAFLRTKNLTQEEIDSALARASASSSPSPSYPQTAPVAPVTPAPQQYQQPYPPYAWQPVAPPVPRRDWRDWFIMATVMGGVGYGLYALTMRYIYPMVAPPTTERLEQDKKTIDEQFDKAFALMEQLAKDTEALKMAEAERTQRLDGALTELETVISDVKSANRRRDDEAQRIRDDIYALRDSIPKAMDAQKDVVDSRLKEVNTELTSLKTLMTQRMGTGSSTGTGGYLRPTNGNAAPSGPSAAPKTTAGGSENAMEAATSHEAGKGFSSSSGPSRASPFNFGGNSGKASIPAWQLAMANKSSGSASAANGADPEGSFQESAGSS